MENKFLEQLVPGQDTRTHTGEETEDGGKSGEGLGKLLGCWWKFARPFLRGLSLSGLKKGHGIFF